jgi:GNAT superfamily N-acetyltransferase
VIDDQDMDKKLDLKDALWIGGVHVHRDFRGKSIGKILIGYIDNYIRQIIFKLRIFTNNIIFNLKDLFKMIQSNITIKQ